MNHIDFKSSDHYNEFKRLAQRLTDPGQTDREYFAALYVISGNQQIRERMLPYMDLEAGTIRTSTIIDDNTFDNREFVLAKLIIHLYNHKEWVLPTELISLPEDDYKLAMQAMTLCRNEQFDGVTIPND
ncbi:hypothetical protein [Exiguobacterium sp. SL-9]|uniref:hypothetical protein n=1 Tax=Exiguobacterium sp. SL-9 TaxID=2510963 RepID=UPI00103F694D|nr:hypothetical protein [Exiguobacterium sp. SL-9]TCI21698.1 hypothetical protein EVJ34_10605 [Exiguobacterium sp. SL-9]